VKPARRRARSALRRRTPLADQYVDLKAIGDGLWSIVY